MSIFHIDRLPVCTHTPETEKILNEQSNKSNWMREQVLKFAEHYGFDWQPNGHKPSFVDNQKWQEYTDYSQRSRRVDYTYIIAYEWLKRLEQFKYSSDAVLLRLIIVSEL